MSKPQSASKKSFTRLDCNRLDDLKKSNAVKTITGLSPQVAPMPQVTSILSAIEQGDGRAAEELLPLVYEELRHLAAQKLAGERPGQTLQATALVHEAWLRLEHSPAKHPWNGRAHFFAAAAEAMRRILVDNRPAQTTAPPPPAATWNGADPPPRPPDLAAPIPDDYLLALDEALDQLGSPSMPPPPNSSNSAFSPA